MITSSGVVLPAVSTTLPTVACTTVNDVLTSTLGRPETAIPPALDVLGSVNKTIASIEGAEKSPEGSDADGDDGSDSSESHGGGTTTPTEKKG